MLLVAVVAFAFLVLVLLRPGLLRRRAIAATFAAFGIVAALVANAVTSDPFLVAAACALPVLLGLLLQEMLDGVVAVTSSQRSKRRDGHRRTPEERERDRARRERDRQRIAA